MGIVTATIATAMTGAAALPPVELSAPPVWHVSKLPSELMPHDRHMIHLTVQKVDIAPAIEAAIRSSLLRSFEHQYDL